MSIATLNRVDSLASRFKALDELWNVVWVNVSKTKLSILVVFTYCVHMALYRDKEAKVVAAGDAVDLYRVAERHLHRVAHFLTLHSERPSKRLSSLAGGQSQISTCCKSANFEALLGEKLQPCRLADIVVVTESKLAPLVATPNNQIVCVCILELYNATVLNSEDLACFYRYLRLVGQI